MDDCPGEIGVVCFQVSVIPEKQKEAVNAEETPAKEKEEKEEVKAEEQQKGPEGTEDFISLDQIQVPESFLQTRPNPYKTQLVIDHVEQAGILEEPITINRETGMLTDGYRRYVVAKKLDIKTVFVMCEKNSIES